MSKFNPSDPLTLGCELPATSRVQEPVDYGRELGTFVQLPTGSTTVTVTGASYNQPGPPLAGSASYYSAWTLFTVYAIDQESKASAGDVHTFTTEVNIAATTGALVGAATALEAVSSPIDTKYINLGAGQTLDLNFTAPPWYVNVARILNVEFSFIMDTAATGGAQVSYNYMPMAIPFATPITIPYGLAPGGIGGTVYNADTGEIFLGGYDYTPGPDNRRRPWLSGDILNIASGATDIRVTGITAALARIHYASMTVSYCEENRVGVGALWEATDPVAFVNPATTPWRPVAQIVNPNTGAAGISVGTTGVKVTITRAKDVNIDGMSRVNNGLDEWYQCGNPRFIAALRPTDRDVAAGFIGRRLSSGLLEAGLPEADRAFAISLHKTTGGSPGPSYAGIENNLTQPYADAFGIGGVGTIKQRFISTQAASYAWARVLVRRSGKPGDMNWAISGAGGGFIQTNNAAYDLAPKDANGWAVMWCRIAGGAQFTAGVARDISATQGGGVDHWEHVFLDTQRTVATDFDLATFGGATQFGQTDARYDLPMTLYTDVPPVTGLVLSRGFDQLSPVSPACPDPVVRGVDYVTLGWGDIPVTTGAPTSGVVIAVTGAPIVVTGTPLTTGFASWEVDRMDQVDPVWRRIARIENRATRRFDDYEARIGKWSDYRVRMVRKDGFEGQWSDEHGYLSFPGTAAAFAQAPDSASFTPPGNFSMVARVKPVQWASGAVQTIFAHNGVTAGKASWALQIDANGSFSMVYSVGGTTTVLATSSTNGLTADNTWLWIGVSFDFTQNTTVTNNLTYMFIAEDRDYDDATDTWQWQFKSSSAQANGGASVLWTPSPATPLTVGALGDGSNRFNGQISDAILYAGSGPTLPFLQAFNSLETLGIPGGVPLFALRRGDLVGPASSTVTVSTGQTLTMGGTSSASMGGVLRLGASTSPTAPIITGGCNAMVLTSNEAPQETVAAPLYFTGGAPVEAFEFSEPDSVVVQRLHGRDYPVAFKPTERGGVRFQRTLLLNALSVPTRRLDVFFQTLRDLAWDDLSYVCVLDDRGGRWFATVLVPDGSVREMNQVYLGSIDVIQTTITPSVVEVP